MPRVWVVLPGGRVTRFKAPQVRHHCRKRRRGRPAVGVGLCYPLNEARQVRRRASGEPVLSKREREVLTLVAQGRTGRQIGQELYVSPTTVKTHLQRIYEKFGVADKAAAVAEGLRRGFVE